MCTLAVWMPLRALVTPLTQQIARAVEEPVKARDTSCSRTLRKQNASRSHSSTAHMMNRAAEGKENASVPTKTLLVPAAAWQALHMRVDELQTQQAETTRYLRAFLKMEYERRGRAATRLQAAVRGALARKRHPIRRPSAGRTLIRTAAQLHVSSTVVDARDRKAHTLEGWACVRLQATCRAHLVRSRFAVFRRQASATTKLQAVARGRGTRRRHGAALAQHRSELRITALEGALQQERKARKAQEAALRKLWADVALLNEKLLPPAAHDAGDA